MPRPIKPRKIKFEPGITYFKPRAMPLSRLEEVNLTHDELEAVRLHDLGDCNQANCAERMKVSASTFQRILASAHRKIAEALIKGKAIKIEKIVSS